MRTVTIHYHGRLVEITTTAVEVLELDSKMNVDQLQQLLLTKYPGLSTLTIKVAQNNALCQGSDLIESSDIDIFPPFSGG